MPTTLGCLLIACASSQWAWILYARIKQSSVHAVGKQKSNAVIYIWDENWVQHVKLIIVECCTNAFDPFLLVFDIRHVWWPCFKFYNDSFKSKIIPRSKIKIDPKKGILEQLQNTGPFLKVFIREWLAGSAVALVLEELSRYIREWLGGSPAQQWP